MSISRWKIMAGVLGVSLGGLAALAGQCPKPGDNKTQRHDDSASAPKVLPPAGSGRAAPSAPLELPQLPGATSAEVLKLPDVPPPLPSPVPSAPPMAKPSAPAQLPMPAVNPPVVPVVGTLPASPPVVAPTVAPAVVPPAVVTGPELTPVTPVAVPPVSAQPTSPRVETPPVVVQPSTPPVVVQPPTPVVNEAPPVRQPQAVSSATKFRIILRVGEGEPMFEVRSGDDLVMKVICEKVDIKSPERGQSLSAVTASGRVRFVGFGSEGTCDTLSFLAGTGEVSMSGNVKIQVKDKLGRVESELTTDSIKYRIDTSILPGTLKP